LILKPPGTLAAEGLFATRSIAMPSSNKVTLSGPTIASIAYIPNTLKVTEGQPVDGNPTVTNDGSGAYIIALSADRKASSDVAIGFNEVTGGAGHVAADGGGSMPNELNFYFGVTLSISTNAGLVPVTLYLGQGNYRLTNNWWIGGNSFLQPPTLLLAISNNLIQEVLKVSLDTSSFKFSL
jgi:hypothetical protein